MKICSILVASFFLLSCANSPAPQFPSEVKDYYAIVIKGEPMPADFVRRVSNADQLGFDVALMDENSAECMHFEIISQHPVKLKYISETLVKKCHLVGGFVPKDTQLFFNWIDDAWSWMETRKHCFKK